MVNNKKLAEYEPYWHKAADRLLRDREIDTPVSFIVHSRREVNEALRKGQYFFTDIRKDGVLLYELDDEPLAEPIPSRDYSHSIVDKHLSALEYKGKKKFSRFFPSGDPTKMQAFEIIEGFEIAAKTVASGTIIY